MGGIGSATFRLKSRNVDSLATIIASRKLRCDNITSVERIKERFGKSGREIDSHNAVFIFGEA